MHQSPVAVDMLHDRNNRPSSWAEVFEAEAGLIMLRFASRGN